MVRTEPRRLHHTPPTQESIDAFDSPSSPDWCRKLLRDESVIPIRTYSRRPKPSGEDSLIAGTLSTPDTIPAWQSFYRLFPKNSNESQSASSSQNSEGDRGPVAGEMLNLVSLGPGLNGHPRLAHGGIISVILDEITGSLAYLHLEKGSSAFTAYLNVTYKKPLPTPGIVLCRGWLEKRSMGRKLYLRATVEDGMGAVYAEGECLYIQAVKDKEKL